MVTPTLGEKAACGVALYGKLWSDALVDLESYNFQILYTDSINDTINTIQKLQPQVVFYMWHVSATNWMSDPVIRNQFPQIKHVAIHHDLTQDIVDNFSIEHHNGGFPYAITANPTIVGKHNVFVTTKLIPPSPTIPYQESSIPIIGYQGFAFAHKGIARLAHQVNQEFDECILRFHMAKSWFSDPNGMGIIQRINEIKAAITKPKIQVQVSTGMMETQDLVNWLSQNTINCYLYDFPLAAGLASAPDYAIAARRPIAVSNNHMLRHFADCTPSVILSEHNTLMQIVANGFSPIEPLYQAYSKENFLQDWSKIIDHLIR